MVSLFVPQEAAHSYLVSDALVPFFDHRSVKLLQSKE